MSFDSLPSYPGTDDPIYRSRHLVEDGMVYAKDAIAYDKDNKFSTALFFYEQAVTALLEAVKLNPSLDKSITDSARQYLDRAEVLKKKIKSTKQATSDPETDVNFTVDTSALKPARSSFSTSILTQDINQLDSKFNSALQLETQGKLNKSLAMYEMCFKSAMEGARSSTLPANEKSIMKTKAEQLLKAAERVREKLDEKKNTQVIHKGPDIDHLCSFAGEHTKRDGPKQKVAPNKLLSYLDADISPYQGLTPASTDNSEERTSPNKLLSYIDTDTTPTGYTAKQPTKHSNNDGAEKSKSDLSQKFSQTEIKVLKISSKINGRLYLPWQDSDLAELIDYREFAEKFMDPDGLPNLSSKQVPHLQGWFRPEDICEEPKMVKLVTAFTIKQTLIGDCSFVSSLAVSAEYERRFKKRLITQCIYPQNKNGSPIINSIGKYFVSMNLNGCRRKIVIDDRLPWGVNGELLCSYSVNREEFWVSLLEKAYIKVMGGYDFPGSSSNIDLHALTGWIPERFSLKPQLSDQLKPPQVFSIMLDSLYKGQAIMTAATGPMNDTYADRAGLVSTHAYAVLDVREVEGVQLVQLKNPWSHKRWKGNFSADDKENWTPDLKRALNYDQLKAMQVDNGVFWIDLKSFTKFFDVVYLNWNPEMFKFSTTQHGTWTPENAGPIKDTYTVEKNPQYRLETKDAGQVWVLLTRHITDKEDFANNKKFITLHIKKSNGRRIYYPGEYDHEGIKINAPHYLAKINIPKGVSHYTLIVAQLEAQSKIEYTLKLFSNADFKFGPVQNMYCHTKPVKDEWTAKTAGGCANHKTFSDNPIYRFELETHDNGSTFAEVLFKLEGPRKYNVGFQITPEVKSAGLTQLNSGSFRPGYAVLETQLPVGNYSLIPSTFNPGEVAPFFLTVSSSQPFKLNRVK